MARLFITQREVDLISDLTKELIKDVIGQKIYYYPVSEIKSDVHDVYEEAPEKIFDNPIEIEALVKYQPQEVSSNIFGTEEIYGIDVFFHKKDLIDKEISVKEGDFFSYGTVFFEVLSSQDIGTVFGQIEYNTGVKVIGRQARKSQFISKIFGPKGEEYNDKDAVQDTFVQQRGQSTNKLGKTGDKRALIEKGVIDKPLTGPKEVSKSVKDNKSRSSFYDEEA
jgi:hypothetical protein